MYRAHSLQHRQTYITNVQQAIEEDVRHAITAILLGTQVGNSKVSVQNLPGENGNWKRHMVENLEHQCRNLKVDVKKDSLPCGVL